MAKNQIALSPDAAIYLSHRYDMQPHPLLRVGDAPLEDGEDARRGIADSGRYKLKQLGLIENDEVHPFLDDAWTLLAHPPMAVGVALKSENRSTFNAVMVEQGRSTIQAYQEDGETATELTDIVLSKHENGGLSGNAVNLLGHLTSGSGGSASVPAETMQAVSERMAATPSGSMRTALASSGIRHADAQVLSKVFSAERNMECVFTVRAYDRKVRKIHTLPVSLSVFATGDGTYMSQRKNGSDGRQWFTVAPADNRKISANIDDMIKALGARR